MPLDLAYSSRIYGWWGRHAGVFRVANTITFLGRESRLRATAVDRIGLRAGDSVLDLACGAGANFQFLEQEVGTSGRLIAFDYSEPMLEAAREQARIAGWDSVELMQGDAARMELPEGSLDGALCTLGLSAIPEHEEAIRNVHRALRPGARFVVLDAKPFRGLGRGLNPPMKALYRYLANWDHSKDLPAALRAVFGAVSLTEHNGGTMFIASAERTR